MKNGLIVSIGLAGWLGLGGAALAGPDLTMSFGVKSGTVRVKNIGEGGSGHGVVIIHCKGVDDAVCPEPTPQQMAAYFDPGYPISIVVDVPPLAPGKSYNHVLSFFDELDFEPGTYTFMACVIADDATPDDVNDRNNCVNEQKTVRRQFGGPGGLAGNNAKN